MRADIHARVKRTAERIAEAAGAATSIEISHGNPVTSNDPALTRRMAPTLKAVAGEANVDTDAPPILGAEDFALYQQVVPGLYVLIGIRSGSTPVEGFPSNHSPRFRIEEEARVLQLGVRTLARLAADYPRMGE